MRSGKEHSDEHFSIEAVLATNVDAVAVGDGLEMPTRDVTPSVHTDTVSITYSCTILIIFGYRGHLR